MSTINRYTNKRFSFRLFFKQLWMIIGIISISSCNDWLEENPKSVAVETFYNTTEEADAAIAAILSKFEPAYDIIYPPMMEVFSEYVYGRGGWTNLSNSFDLDASNEGRMNNMWSAYYKAIRDCNIAIIKLPEASELTETQKSEYLGESRFLRAFSYYEIVRLWGDVPLRTEDNMDKWDLGKSTTSDIYHLIIADLKISIEEAPEKSRLTGTPNKWSARALLAHVYLTLGEYEESRKLYQEVVESNKYSLVKVSKVRDFDKIYGPEIQTSSEDIFSIGHVATGSKGWQYVMFCAHPSFLIEGKKMHGAGGWYGLYTRGDHPLIQEWDDNDLRKSLNIGKVNLGMNLGTDTYILCKYYDSDAPNSLGARNPAPLIRYSEVMLNYAEAIARVEGKATSEALEYINRIHRRAYGLDPLASASNDYKLSDYNSLDEFIELLVNERGYECFNEAKRFLELKRLGLFEERVKTYKKQDVSLFMSRNLFFPIPTSEFNYNKGLNPETDQNPGY